MATPERDDLKPFPFVLEGYSKPKPFTIREQAMMLFVDHVTDKPLWYEKVFDDEIVGKWRTEIAAMAKAAEEPLPDSGADGYSEDGEGGDDDNDKDDDNENDDDNEGDNDHEDDDGAEGDAADEQHGEDDNNEAAEGDGEEEVLVFNVLRKGFSDAMFDYCIAELRHKAKVFERVGFVEVFETFASVFKADGLVPDDLRDELIKAVKSLEDVPEKDKDWHPGSDGKASSPPMSLSDARVLDEEIALEDTLASIGSGKVHEGPMTFRLQWLPAEVDLQDDGTAKFVSYINNLHPRHKELYDVLGQLVSKFVPMWSATYKRAVDGQLDDPDRRRHERIEYSGGLGFHCHMSVKCLDCSCIDRECMPDEWRPAPQWVDESEYTDDDGSVDLHGLFDWWADEAKEMHTAIQPEPTGFQPESEASIAATFLSRGPWFEAHEELSKASSPSHRLQVIVKLANIHLTPENPTYDGGSWHIEGSMREAICATGIYYYDEENVTPSYLAFRTGTETEDFRHHFDYQQSDHREFEQTFPLGDARGDGESVFNLGAVNTRQGRLLAFPNVIQHRVEPFELVDQSKPGHRKIVAFFLVDPAYRITSTATVPPQQKHWAHPSLLGGKLPIEIKEMITSHLDCPYGWDEAVKYREELMKDRSVFRTEVGDVINDGKFNLCEH